MRKILLINILLAFLIGCGSGGSDDETPREENQTQESNNSTPVYEVDYTIPLVYDYNEDGSSRQRLAPLYVNQYQEVQEKLNENKNDSTEFYSILSGYIGDLYRKTESLTTIPSYAPSGESKSLVVTVANGQVDYSDYKLKGDVDFNWEVDFNDLKLLSEAILNDVDSFQYDINGDGKVDTLDVIDLVARFGNEIKTFDFYTTDGVKLDIASRTVEEEKSFSYGGSETEMMVVAKDRNGASGFERGLSDSDDVWYKQDGWELEETVSNEKSLKSSKIISEGVEGVQWNFLGSPDDIKSFPYLVGMSYEISYHNTVHPFLEEVFKIPLTDLVWSSFLDNKELEISRYFEKTDMNHPLTIDNDGKYYHLTIGPQVSDRFSIRILDLDLISNYVRRFDDGRSEIFVAIKHSYLLLSMSYVSIKSHMLVGELQKNDGSEVKGSVIVVRIGPDQEDLLTGTIEDSTFSVESASFGAYKILYLDECACSESLGEYVFEEEGEEPEFTISDIQKVPVKLTLEDKEGEPLESKVVKIVANPCVDVEESERIFSSVTDSQGRVDFSNVPIGDYMVYVDGKENSELHFCEAYNGKLSTEKLWDIDLFIEDTTYPPAQRESTIDASPLNYQGEFHWQKVKIFGIEDPFYGYQEAAQRYNQGNGYLPYGVTSRRVLGETSWGSVYDDGYPVKDLQIEYANTSEGEVYMIVSLSSLISDNRSPWRQGNVLRGILSYNFDKPYLSATQVESLRSYKAFSLNISGVWSSGNGETNVVLKFTPSH